MMTPKTSPAKADANIRTKIPDIVSVNNIWHLQSSGPNLPTNTAPKGPLSRMF